jgi:capsular exopolysaccharide synthesis family protein
MSILSKNKENRIRQIAEARKQENQRFVLDENTPFNVTESFRKLKAGLSVSVPKHEKGGVSISVTSSYPEDGKTTVSINLAVMFAMSSKARVVIVDADIRKGRVANYFNGKSAPGLSEYLSGQVTLEEVIRKSGLNENLDYISCGTHSPKPFEMLESDVMKELDKLLRERYDYVIYDTSPLLLVSDALAIAPLTDGTVIVCRHMRSYVRDLTKTVNTLKFSKVNVLGVVLNDFKRTGKKVVGYKNYYEEKYSYGYGSDESVEAPKSEVTELDEKSEE